MTHEETSRTVKFNKVKALSDAIYRIMREKKQSVKQALELQDLMNQRTELLATMPMQRVK